MYKFVRAPFWHIITVQIANLSLYNEQIPTSRMYKKVSHIITSSYAETAVNTRVNKKEQFRDCRPSPGLVLCDKQMEGCIE